MDAVGCCTAGNCELQQCCNWHVSKKIHCFLFVFDSRKTLSNSLALFILNGIFKINLDVDD